ncbi:hypothetical protein AB9K41_13015 [Cribrihabitans sp. XS_ASV171]
MKSIFATTAALALLITEAQALVLTENAKRGDRDQSFVEQNAEFVGDPVYDADGMRIGAVTRADTSTKGNRRIHVTFDEGVVDGVAGWVFTLNPVWRSGGSIELTWTADALRNYLLANAR